VKNVYLSFRKLHFENIFKFKNEDIFTKCRKAMDKQATINQLLKKNK